MVFRPPEDTRKVWKVLFEFNHEDTIAGFLRFGYEARTTNIESSSIIKKLLSALPIITEGIVLEDREILIKLPTHFRQKIFRRDHIIKPGQIVYRPHIPAISIFIKPTNLYEPVEIIGELKREDRKAPRDSPPQRLVEIVEKLKTQGSFLVKIMREGSVKKRSESDEE